MIWQQIRNGQKKEEISNGDLLFYI